MRKAVAKVPELDQQKRGSEKRRIKVHMKEIGFHWSEEADQSFRSLKRAVLENACHEVIRRGNITLLAMPLDSPMEVFSSSSRINRWERSCHRNSLEP